MFTQFQDETRRDAICNEYGFDIEEEESFFKYLNNIGLTGDEEDEIIESAHVMWRDSRRIAR